MGGYPRVLSVETRAPYLLVVTFDNGVTKRYDCAPLLNLPAFAPLRAPAFFQGVRVDPGGYGVSWSDDIDLAEAELWSRGNLAAVDEQTEPMR